jgi:tRNA uridine 5-carboxymethylaminomethyl modification enzyme
LDWDALDPQVGDDPPVAFSDLPAGSLARGAFPGLPQVECRLTETTPEIHALIRDNLHLAPMYSGQIDAECGPRYCPSLEDKVVRFASRSRHTVFLEPEGHSSDLVYPAGLSTSSTCPFTKSSGLWKSMAQTYAAPPLGLCPFCLTLT